MAAYYVSNLLGTASPDSSPEALSTSLLTLLSGLAQTATLRRGRVTEMKLGPIGAPSATDCNILWRVGRQTADNGTGMSVVTPNYTLPIEGGTAPACSSKWQINYSAEPTIGIIIWEQYLNQHSGFVYYAEDGLQWPALNANGLAFDASSSNFTGTAFWSANFEE